MKSTFLYMIVLLLIKRVILFFMECVPLTVVATKSNMTCHTAISSDIDLWHQRLGHVNHTDLDNLAKNEIILGLPKHLKAPNTVCGPCQIGKQIRS